MKVSFLLVTYSVQNDKLNVVFMDFIIKSNNYIYNLGFEADLLTILD